MTPTHRSPHPAPSAPPIRPTVVDAAEVPERRGTMAFLSNVTREGDWTLPRNLRVLAVMGNVELDLTRARLSAGTSEIEIASVMGSITVLIPPDVRVDCEGEPVLGSFEMKRDAQSTTAPDAPLVRIRGKAFFGSVEIRVVDPNALGWLDKLRDGWSSWTG
jgi:hypothetical protein